MSAIDFYFDVSSPYAYLAAERIDSVLPGARWRPFSFGVLLRETGRVPWSMSDDTRPAGQADVEQRAAERGLPPVRWPRGWPADSYSLLPLLALHYADTRGSPKELTHALYGKMFAEGVALDDVAPILEAATECGLDAATTSAALESDDTRTRLREATSEAIARGVVGVPTVAIGDQLFWGDDQLEEAARAAGIV